MVILLSLHDLVCVLMRSYCLKLGHGYGGRHIWLCLFGRHYSHQSRTGHIPTTELLSDPAVPCGVGELTLGLRLTVARKGMGKAASSDLGPSFYASSFLLVCFRVSLGVLSSCPAVQASLSVVRTLADSVGTWFHDSAESAWFFIASSRRLLTVASSLGRFLSFAIPS